MPAVVYPAVLERTGQGYSLFFPDLPGCTSAGDTAQQAVLNAEAALSGHLAVAAEHGDAIPAPSTLDALAQTGIEAGLVLLRAEIPGRTVRINITLDEALVAAIDRVATNRSRFLADAARQALAEQGGVPSR